MAHRTDVVVVGGGVVGLCIADALTRAGRSVTVLDRGPICAGASCGNAGLIVPSHIIPLAAPGVIAQGLRWLFNPESPFYIKPRLDPSLFAWLWAFRRYATEAHVEQSIPILRDLCLASADLFSHYTDHESLAFSHERKGLLMVYQTDKGRTSNLRMADQAEASGLLVRRLAVPELLALEPGIRTPCKGAILYEQDSHASPDQFMYNMSNRVQGQGGKVLYSIAATEIHATAGRITSINTDAGMITADEFVLCAGVWSVPLARPLGLRLPIEGGKGYSMTLPQPDRSLTLPLIMTEDKVTITPMGSQLRFGGTLALTGLDRSVDARRIMPLRRMISAYCPELRPPEVEAAAVWSGLRPCTPDGLPIIGRAPGYDNLTLATGHAMLGFTLGPITGRLIADLLTDRPPQLDLTPFSLSRFG